MAAPTALRCFTRRLYGSTAALEPQNSRLLRYLCSRFYDVEYLVSWSAKLRERNLRRKNAYCGYIKKLYGDDIAAAYFVLSRGGGVRFQGQENWFRADRRGKYSTDFLELRNVPVVAVDLAGSIVNYNGLDNLVQLKALTSLDLSRCPHVDDWVLTRLHVFADTLEELSLAGCPQVTDRGLACLHHLEHLRRLDLSHLPVPNAALIQLLVEDMLPRCEVVGLALAAGTQPSRLGAPVS
ncbi:distal membrane-arm assembly complex protein 2 [Carettochelys insculpta]|uniref:distal membrane-arm assembly complex protein 2 n=1 Tax=Carettochelys insculpta TaxID=44489 RepID=UPI003EB8DDE9